MAGHTKKAAAIALAAGLLIGSTGGLGSQLANAQPTGGDGTTPGETAVTAEDIATIDWTRQGSLTINKRLNPETTGKPTGVEGEVSGQGLDGVTFTIQRIQLLENGEAVPFNTNEGFQKYANALQNGLPQDTEDNPYTVQLGQAVEVTTANGGLAKFDELDLGAYWVQETDYSNANINGEPVDSTILPAQPFVAFVPMTHVTGDDAGVSWNYEPVAYPKNSTVTTSKTVNDRRQNVGDQITYTLNASVPTPGQGRELTEFWIDDLFHSSELSFNPDNYPTSATLTPTGDGEAISLTLTEDDFQLNPPGVDRPTGQANSVLRINLANQTNLEALRDNPGATVSLNLNADVLPIAQGDGAIHNQVRTVINTPVPGGDDNITTVPGNTVVTYLAKLEIFKHIAGKETPLQGAEFQLYECSIDIAPNEQHPTLGDRISIGTINEWTTNAQGLIEIDGLHVTDFENNQPVDAEYQYCLLETKAPEGYELNPNPIPVTFQRAAFFEFDDDGNLIGQKENGAEATPTSIPYKQVAVPNEETTTTYLPSTGGMGVLILLLVGAGVIGAGAYGLRRTNQAA